MRGFLEREKKCGTQCLTFYWITSNYAFKCVHIFFCCKYHFDDPMNEFTLTGKKMTGNNNKQTKATGLAHGPDIFENEPQTAK